MFYNNQQNLIQRLGAGSDNRHSITINAKLSVHDTYITNKQSENTSRIFDPKAQKFIEITDTDLTQEEINAIGDIQYSAGLGNNILYRERPYLKVGTDQANNTFRAIVTANPKNEIKEYLQAYTGTTADTQYRVGKTVLTLSPFQNGTTTSAPDVFAVLFPLGTTVDDTASWEKPSELYDVTWKNPGGDTESVLQTMMAKGIWDNPTNPTAVSFDLSQYMSIWKGKEDSSFAVGIVGDGLPKAEVLKFFSNESTYVQIGGTQLTNCSFFTGTESQITRTNGIRVLITPTGLTSSISFDDSTLEAEKEWNIFNSATVIGSTGNIISPDQEQGLVIGTVTFTVNEKKSSSRGPVLVVSGLCLGSIQNYYTTAEFFTVNNVNLGTGYAELSSPDTRSLTDINALKANDIVRVEYLATTAQNNVRQFTVKFTTDEKNTLNRARIYFNEPVITENRIGQVTNLFISTKQPVLNVQLLL